VSGKLAVTDAAAEPLASPPSAVHPVGGLVRPTPACCPDHRFRRSQRGRPRGDLLDERGANLGVPVRAAVDVIGVAVVGVGRVAELFLHHIRAPDFVEWNILAATRLDSAIALGEEHWIEVKGAVAR
jgi:hypothetical protein